jgi:uncharacterized phage protein gp47/JayE
MSLTFTVDGLEIQTFDEIYAELVTGYQAIYGADINLDPDSPDGQRIGIEAKLELDAQAFALALYNQFDPDFATGESLNKIIKWSGVTRQPASRSQVDITVTVDRVLDLPDGYAVSDDLDQTWITTALTSCTVGANTVTFVSEDFGAVEAEAGTITVPVDIIIGVVSVTNAAAATVGVDEESDGALRIRRNNSLSTPATSTVGGLYAAIGNLPGVTDLAVYENTADTTDVTRDLSAHSIWCIVEGGVASDIIETIAKNKTGGAGIKGSVLGTYTETLTKPDGTTIDLAHDMAFDRPTEIPIYITLTVEGLNGAAVNVTAIKAALAALDLGIAETLSASSLYATVYAAATGFAASLLEISDDDITYTDDYLTPAADEVYTIAVADITVTDITP